MLKTTEIREDIGRFALRKLAQPCAIDYLFLTANRAIGFLYFHHLGLHKTAEAPVHSQFLVQIQISQRLSFLPSTPRLALQHRCRLDGIRDKFR